MFQSFINFFKQKRLCLLALGGVSAMLGFSVSAFAGNGADLAVVKTASAPLIPAGSNLVYTIVASANSTGDTVVVDDDLPLNTTFVSISNTGSGTFVCSTPAVGANGTVSCTAPSMPAAGNTFTLTVNVDAATPNGTVITNTADISAAGVDSNLLNNTSSVNVDVTVPPADVCGDGVVGPTEECDDGNTVDGDCCDSTCVFEPVDSICNDGDEATSDDVCDGAGNCSGIVIAGPVDISGSGCSLGTGAASNPFAFLGLSLTLVGVAWRRFRR